jgi:hypothetical protein
MIAAGAVERLGKRIGVTANAVDLLRQRFPMASDCNAFELRVWLKMPVRVEDF